MALPWTNYSLMRKAVTSNTMPREKEDYRANLERLNRLFPDREMLGLPDAMQIMGWKSRTTAYQHLNIVNGKVSKVRLAKEMSL